MIVTDIKKLKQRSQEVDLEEGKKLSIKLFEVLANVKKSICLSANQIGINKRVGVLNVRTPIYLVNPEILSRDVPFYFLEDDISFPNQLFKTFRYASIIVKSDNFKNNLRFGLSELGEEVSLTDPKIIEAVAIQHLIDSMNGKLISETRTANSEKINRNEKILITKNSEELIIKRKKLDDYISCGWSLKNN